MRLKFSIVSELDPSILDRQLNGGYIQHNLIEPYIFMNEETLLELSRKFNSFDEEIPTDRRNQSLIAYYQGHKVFMDTTLKYGEVEII